MLITCKECELPVSDKALSCPHCGIPLKENIKPRTSHRRRMRLPNGFGQITELKGRNLRKPFRAMVTVGKSSTGKPICKLLEPEAYFETYNDAYLALAEYNKSPYDFDKVLTVKELYDAWSKEYFEKLKSSASIRTITSAWAKCTSLYDYKARDIRAYHIKDVMKNCDSENIRNRVKSLFNLMLDYAVEHEICDKNYARDFNVEAVEAKKEHISFTKEEMDKLWDSTSIPFVNIILIQCYMGWRPQELCELKLENIDLVAKTVMGGMKTKAGTDRVVPIHSKILNIITRMKSLSESLGATTLVCDNEGGKLTYDKYYKKFMKQMEELDFPKEHRPHDPRKQFVTMCKNAGVDEYAIKYMVGHVIDDITEKIYTNREEGWLAKEIEKI